METGPARPLAGVRVLELARILAGPWCGQLLADLGAEVIKIERAGAGDDTRSWGPPFIRTAEGADWGAAYFHACNRGKRSVAVDFDSADGRALVQELAAGADVVIENFKVGGLAKYGLDWPSLKALNPGLVYCSVTGFGQDGPYAQRAGYDFMIQGLAGLMSITGEPEREPQKVGVAVVDVFTGVYAAVAILAALRRRDATGEGAHVDMSLLDVATSILANQAMNYLASGTSPGRLGNAHPNIVPYQVFAVADGHVIVAVGNDGQFRRFCALIGAETLGSDPRFAGNGDRVERRAELVERLAPLLSAVTRADLLGRCEAAGVPAGPINSVADVFADAQVIHRGMKLKLAGADGSTVAGVASPIVIDGVRMVAEGASPMLGTGAAAWAGGRRD